MAESIVWNVTSEDVAKNALVEPGWHPTEIYDMKIEDSKDKDSKNIHYFMRIFAGPFKGAENNFIYFSEKLPVAMVPLLEACGFLKNPDGSVNVNLSKEVMVGKKFMAHWVRGEYKNKPVNQIQEYAPMS